MAAGLAQKELQRVGRRLLRDDRRRRRWRWRCLLRLVDDLDSALVELSIDGIGLEQSELVRLEDLRELSMSNRTGLLSSFEQLLKLLVCQEGVQLDCRHTRPSMVPREAVVETLAEPLSGRRTITVVMSSRNLDIHTGLPWARRESKG